MAYTVVDKGSKFFNTTTYSGTGSNQTITVGFQPDFVWTKRRNAGYSNELQDAVRGSTKVNYSDNTNAEDTTSTNIQSFNSTGYVIGTGAGVNASDGTYCSWNWLGANTTVSNNSGSITSTVSANTTSGFSIVSFTGNGSNSATVGHGLGVVPKMIIEKSRTASFDGSWWVNHNKITSGTLRLNSTDATRTDFPSGWINESPTSSTFSFTAGSGGTVNNVNYSGDAYIAYCFAEVKGFSKFGSYTGNGSTDGTFVYTGFKPALVLQKTTSTTSDWNIVDNKRSTYNVNNLRLNPNTSSAESTSPDYCDLLSNGFKFRASSSGINGSGETNIYAAFAENPFVSSKGIPTSAR